MDSNNTIGLHAAWIIPLLSAIAFLIIVISMRLVGFFFSEKNKLVMLAPILSITAILTGFILFWLVLLDVLNFGGGSISMNWLTVGLTEIRWGIFVDKVSVTMLGLVTFIALLVQVYSLGYMKGDRHFEWYFAIHSLFAAAMLTLVLADNLLFLYFAWELVGLGSYLLIGFWWEKRSAAEAAKKAFITTRIGDVCLLIGIILLFKATGTFNISTIFHIAESGGIGEVTLNSSILLIFIGAMGKSAQFPFHVWLPDAMEGPTPVSALIHAATMVAAGVYLVARMMPIFQLAPEIMLIVMIIGLITFIFAGSMALVMSDIKKVLAYSTISHLGLMMLCLGAGGVAAAIFHLVVHGIAKALLFLGAGSVMHSISNETNIWKMGGLRHRMPITAVTFFIGAASLAGLPPLAGFFSKDELLLSVLNDGQYFVLAITLFGVFLSALYMARIAIVPFFGSTPKNLVQSHESSFILWVPLVILAILSAGVGVLILPLSSTYPGWAEFIDPTHHFEIEPWLMILSILLALVALILGWSIYIRKSVSAKQISQFAPYLYKTILNKYYVDDFYQWIIDKCVLTVGRFVALFDRVVINDTAVDGTAISIYLSALKTRVLQTGYLFTYGAAMAIGACGLAILWWVLLD
ncbi:MAG: NADH-quinone oxidoreductase subunit L [Dehalococcoidia bacterium]|nr:NADH-quinone oxidoreductase subunit L [Dehalococcoidia bacterium]